MKLLRWGLYACSILLPLSLLFDLQSSFYFDWQSALWLSGYYGEYFRHHAVMPMTLNTLPAVGHPLPLFYGYLLYPALGALSALLGPALALRAAILALVAVEFHALLAAGRRAFRHDGVSYLLTVSGVWSVYALTNLYNRSDMPEYFATSLLVASVAYIVAAAAEQAHGDRRFLQWMAFVTALLAAGTHPPTALVAAPLLFALGILFAFGALGSRREAHWKRWAAGGAVAAAGCLILSPWVYVTLRMREKLAIIEEWGSAPLQYYADRCDSLLGRFGPIPFDRLSNRQGTVNVGTPYLEAPVIFGLLLLLAWNVLVLMRSTPPPRSGESRRSLWETVSGPVFVVAVAWFAFLAALSLSPDLANLGAFRSLGPMLQYAYRLVSHCNVALVIAALASGTLVAQRGGYLRFPNATRIVVAVGITVALGAAATKLLHADAITLHPDPTLFSIHGDRSSLAVDGNASLDWQYSTPGSVQSLSNEVAASATWAIFSVGSHGGDFGTVANAEVDLPTAGWAMTNLVVFPWTKVLVNGRVWDGALGENDHFLALYLPAGRSTLEWSWSPDPIWSILHRLSGIAYVLVMAVAGIWIAARIPAAFSPTPRQSLPTF
jgi:hypothetical protein